MEQHWILYFEPDDWWAQLLRHNVRPDIQIVRVRTLVEAHRVITRNQSAFRAVAVGVFDIEISIRLQAWCDCPIVAAAWLPRDNQTLLKFGCTKRVPRKEGLANFLTTLFES